MNATELASEVLRREQASIASRIRRTRQDHPRASSIGKCAREVYYQIAAWDRRPSPDADLEARFEVGRVVERETIRSLLANGFEVTEGQTAFEIREPYHDRDLIICTGHYEGRLRIAGDIGRGIIFEIKSLVGFVFDKVEQMEDFTRLGAFWERYPKQLLVYLYHHAEPEGMYILRALDGRMKCIPVRLEDHLDICELALRTCREAAIGASEGVPPPHYRDPAVCLECWARECGECQPPMDFSGSGIRVLSAETAADLADRMERAARLEPAGKRWNELVESIKATAKALPPGEYLAGEWFIRSVEQVRKNGSARLTDWRTIAPVNPSTGGAEAPEAVSGEADPDYPAAPPVLIQEGAR